VAPSLLDGCGRGRPVGVDQATARVGFAGLQTVLERLQQSGEHIVVGYLLGEEQALHGVVVGVYLNSSRFVFFRLLAFYLNNDRKGKKAYLL